METNKSFQTKQEETDFMEEIEERQLTVLWSYSDNAKKAMKWNPEEKEGRSIPERMEEINKMKKNGETYWVSGQALMLIIIVAKKKKNVPFLVLSIHTYNQPTS